MSIARILFTGLALACGATFAAQAAPVMLNIRPGLWEMSTQGEASGTLPVPPELLARMTPERRAKFEAAMAASRARMSKPHTSKQCISEASLKRGIDVDQDKGEHHCRETVLSSSSSVMDLHMECSGGRATTTGTIHFQAASPEAVTGTINMAISDGAHTMTMKRVIEGKWVAADCGDVKSFGN